MKPEKPWWWYSHVCIIFIIQTLVIGVLLYSWLLSLGEHWPSIGFGVMLGIPAAYYVRCYLLVQATQAETLYSHTRDAGRIILGGIILLYMLTLALQSEILGMIVMTLLISDDWCCLRAVASSAGMALESRSPQDNCIISPSTP